MLQPQKPQSRNDKSPNRSHNQIRYRINQPRFQHTSPEKIIHRKLKKFPENSKRHRKTKPEKCNKIRTKLHMFTAPIHIIRQRKPNQPHIKPSNRMQHQIPPPKPLIKKPYLPQKKTRKNKK